MLKPSLVTFVQVCRFGSFTRTAEKLFITPSAVMQQMDALERDFGVKLLVRTHHGVKPTPAGAYLLEEAQAQMRRSGEVRARVSAIASENDMICIGTSLIEKCRLLYDLWALYSEKNPACRIQMVNISAETGIPDCADMVESLNSGIGWMREWEFFEICRVPIGIAMESAHPLAKKAVFEPRDLVGQQVGTFRGTAYEGLSELHRTLETQGTELFWMDYPTPSVFWECAFQHRLLLAPLCWSDILPGLTLRPVRWPYSLPYGIFTRERPRREADHFLRFIKEMYTGADPETIVPMLTY